MQIHVASAALLACVLLGGCNSQQLTRSKAAELLKQQLVKEGNNRVTQRVSVGDAEVPYRTLEDYVKREDLGRLFAILAKRKLVDITWKGLVTRNTNMGPREFGILHGELTNDGRRYAIGDEGTDQGRKYATVRLCDQEIDSITGIKLEGDNKIAQVYYKWKRVNPTPFEAALREWAGSRPICNGELVEGAAGFRLYDDGWRIGQ